MLSARFRALIRSPTLNSELLRGGFSGIVVRVLSLLASLGSAAVLARCLGAAEYGAYSYVFTAVSTLALPVQLGLPTLVVRETARAVAAEDWKRLRGIWTWTSLVIVGASILAGVLIVAWLYLSPGVVAGRREAFLWALPLIPLVALGRARAAALRGLRRVFAGQFPDNVLRPILHATGVGAIFILYAEQVTSQSALALHSAAAFVAFGVGAVLVMRSRPAASLGTGVHFEHAAWLRSIVPLSLVAGLQVVLQNTDLLMLGWWRTDAEVGVYKIAVSASTPVTFGLTVFNSVMQPHLARLHAQGEKDALQRLVTMGAVVGTATMLPILATFILAGGPLLSLAFGAEYVAAYGALVVLSLGQGVNASFGAVGNLLTMSGHERDTAVGLAVAALVNVVLNAALIPTWGGEGAAIATATSTVLWNALLWLSAWRRLGIDTTMLSIVRLRRKRES